MHSKNYRQNHDFQIIYQLVGKCHTPDAAYALLCDLRDDRENSLIKSKANSLRFKVKEMQLDEREEFAKTTNNEKELLLIEADRIEHSVDKKSFELSVAAAEDELKTILDAIDKIQPYRKYSKLTDREANEAYQREEWKLEYIERATTQLLTTGGISAEELSHIHVHPDFHTDILPAIANVVSSMKSSNGLESACKKLFLEKNPLYALEDKTGD